MVTAYYIMKMCQNNKDFYNISDIPSVNSVCRRTVQKCRVCLREGSVSIFEVENSSDVIEALQFFGTIEVHVDDKYPKQLCKGCYKFIKSAILFRKIAKQSNEVLQSALKDETSDEEFDDIQKHENEPSDDDSDKLIISDPMLHYSKVKNKKSNSVEPPIKEKPNAKVQCYICNTVVTRAYYKHHMTMHDPNHPKYVCDVCGKSFRLRCAYHNHSLRHRNDFPFQCQYCPYKARYKELLKTHMRTHTGEYRYMCTECPARFLFKSNFNRHVLIKHREPQYKCDSCKRAFHTKLTLDRHFEADHLGIKNHMCNMCGKAFGYRNAMMKHQRHVHKREKQMFSRMPSYLEAEMNNSNSDVSEMIPQ